MAPQEGGEFIDQFDANLGEWKEKWKWEKKEGEDEDDRVKTKSADTEIGKIEELFGFENEIKSMENFLLDQKVYNEFKSLVIVGEYGVGKTALCQKIFNIEEVKSVYSPRIWVSMHSSKGIDGKVSVLKKILKEDLGAEESLLQTINKEAVNEYERKRDAGDFDGGESAEDKELSGLLYALHLHLRWRKYLIVFDDVREDDDWNEKLDEKLDEDEKWGKHLSDGFPKGSGGRVIYTTRDKNLAEDLVEETHQTHRLWPLSDLSSIWKIYAAAVKKKDKDKDLPRNDKKCMDELMNKTRGLPLAVKMLANLDPVFLDDEDPKESSTLGTGTPDPPNGRTSPSQV